MDLFGSDELFNVFETEQVPASAKLPAKRKNNPKPVQGSSKKKSKVRKKKQKKVAAEDEEVVELNESGELDSESEDDMDVVVVEDRENATPGPEEGWSEAKMEESTSASAGATVPKDEGIENPGKVEEFHPASDAPEESKKESVPAEVKKTEEEEDEDEENRSHSEDLAALQKFLPQVEIRTLETPEGSGCTHVVTTPMNNFYYIPLHPIAKPVKTYPFKLDLFQDRAVQCVDNYQSVLVSAHTSAGKTVVAEYVILSLELFLVEPSNPPIRFDLRFFLYC